MLFITFTDDATHFTLTYLPTAKSNVLSVYQQFEAWARTQNHCTAIKVLHSDHDGEYLSKAFNKHLADTGITCRLTIHDTLQLNGIAECLIWTLIEKVCALLHMAQLSQSLWEEAALNLAEGQDNDTGSWW